MSAKSPSITLDSGVRMPALGLGVFQSPPAETAGAVEAAIATGYRLIDTAAAFAIEQPEDVDINEILFRPTRQEL